MNKFERLKEMSSSEAQEYLKKLVGEDKAKLFFEEEKKTADICSVKEGSFINYAGLEWVVLEHRKKGTLILAKHRLYNRAFDSSNHNDWEASSLRAELNNFNAGGYCVADERTGRIKKSDLVEFERDLLTDDGMTDYGKCKDYVSLITCEEYRKFRKLIPNADDWWWTATADSLVYNSFVRIVYSSGTLNSKLAYFSDYGVRPLCLLKSDTEVELCDEKA